MTEYARLCDAVDAGSVVPGDEILVHPMLGLHLVSAVDRYDTSVVISYFSHEETTMENRARDRRGLHSKRRLVEKELKPMHPCDPVLVVRGSAGAADTMRERMVREQAERWTVKAERAERAQHFERERKEAR